MAISSKYKKFNNWYGTGQNMGGVFGCTIGVTDIEAAKKLYVGVLGYNAVVYDQSGTFDDFGDLPGGKETFRRIVLQKQEQVGGFF